MYIGLVFYPMVLVDNIPPGIRRCNWLHSRQVAVVFACRDQSV